MNPYTYPKKFKLFYTLLGILLILFMGIIFYDTSIRAPKDFPQTAIISIPSGASLTDISKSLQEKHIIRSPFWFTNFVIFFKHEKTVAGGTYYFPYRMNVFQIATQISEGKFNTDQLKTTIPEGTTIFDISQIIKKNYPNFDDIHFLTIAKGEEGYLFPDTYFFGANVQPEKVLSIMTSTFNKKIASTTVQIDIQNFGKPLSDIVTMASILEGEARQMQTRRIIAGILWHRIELGIPLQVDAAFRYVNGKTTEQLTASDLKIDSPYNTYLYKGLPPTPISNPGLESIIAAATPIQTDYLYFLTDADGNMHYAKTLEEHTANKKKYLK